LQLSEHQLGQVFSQRQRQSRNLRPHLLPNLSRNLHLRLHLLRNLHR
jgi:hypothetical protein